MEKKKYTIRIQDRDYTILSSDSEEYVRSVAFVVDKKLTEISAINPSLSTAMSAILVALNLADEYMKSEKSNDNLREQVTNYGEEMDILHEECGMLRTEMEEAKSKARKLEIELAKKETELTELRNRNKK